MSVPDAGAASVGATSSTCGDSVVDGDELCDGNCPSECVSDKACVASTLVGDPALCTAVCEMSQITECAAGDGCCPTACTYADDTDCSPSCGDGVLSAGETCEAGSADAPCPTPADCDDGDPCTADDVMGSPEQCNAQCLSLPITRAAGGDMCCPPGANANTDSDCSAMCGNRVVEDGELCDGSCPTTCSGGTGCQKQALRGTAQQCNAMCVPETITERRDNDGCCPQGANATNDRDCPGCRTAAECKMGESCNAGECECSGVPSPTNKQHCGTCGNACSDDEDCVAGRCEARCGNGTVDPGEACDESAPGWTGSRGSCANCRLTPKVYMACSVAGAECWSGSTSVGWVCSGAGACSRTCRLGSNDCVVEGGSGSCVSAGPTICVQQNLSICEPPLRLNWYGTEGDSSAVTMCGWVSIGKDNRPWCPKEYGKCCPPAGGECIPWVPRMP